MFQKTPNPFNKHFGLSDIALIPVSKNLAPPTQDAIPSEVHPEKNNTYLIDLDLKLSQIQILEKPLISICCSKVVLQNLLD